MSDYRALAPTLAPRVSPPPPDSPNKKKRGHSFSSLRHRHEASKLLPWILLLCGAATVAVLSANRYLRSVHVLDSPIQPRVDVPMINISMHTADERMLRLVIEECSKQEDSVIWVDKELNLVVQEAPDPTHCPLIDAMLAGPDRDLATCTDFALYVMHGGARIIPVVDREQYDRWCGAKTVRLFWESMYPSFISHRSDVLHFMLVDHEHFWAHDSRLHKHMNVFLCKTDICMDLMRKHVVKMGYRAQVWLMGHTSSDPTVDIPPNTVRKSLAFLHVKGGSHLKHTTQLLQCWSMQPDFPHLTVVGSFSWEDVEPYQDALNIQFLPSVSPDGEAGSPQQRVPFTQLRQLQVGYPIHICTSERASWGHDINEARATGAVIITVDHPPMNELIVPESGVLIQPERLVSYREMALGKYGPITARVAADQICRAVEDVLAMSKEEIHTRGHLARSHFLYGKSTFLARMKDLRTFLEQRAQGLQSMENRAGLWQHGGVSQERAQFFQVEDMVPNV